MRSKWRQFKVGCFQYQWGVYHKVRGSTVMQDMSRNVCGSLRVRETEFQQITGRWSGEKPSYTLKKKKKSFWEFSLFSVWLWRPGILLEMWPLRQISVSLAMLGMLTASLKLETFKMLKTFKMPVRCSLPANKFLKTHWNCQKLVSFSPQNWGKAAKVSETGNWSFEKSISSNQRLRSVFVSIFVCC